MFRVILFAATVFSFLFWGCGVTEPTLTPTHDKQTKQAVTTTLSMAKKGDGDTLVYLSKSKLKFKLKKEFTKEQIAQIDEYLATHEIPTVSDTIISPMRELCGTHDSYGWAFGNSYIPVAGKYLGIALSQDVVTYYNALHKYGFSKIFVWGDYDMNLAYLAGFSYDNMMFGIANPQQQQIPTNVGSYHIDEVFEKHSDVWDDYTISQKAATVYPKKVFLSSYKWPSWPYSYPVTYGAKYGSAINSGTNIFIMCDEYSGNCAGHYFSEVYMVDDYWDEFWGYYGHNKNISNWLNLTANNGDGNTHVACAWSNADANSWYDMLGNANRKGINEVWLWASGTGNEVGVQNFSEQAWEKDWLLRSYGYYCIVWRCDSQPCYPDCQWGVGLGEWYISQIYKLGAETYLPYSPSSAQ
jgi:hypothetical protein